MKIFLFPVLAALAFSALAQPKVVDGVLTDSKGMTLYVWDNDLTVPGKIQCVGVCVMSWPPMLAGPADTPTGEYTLIVRDDGKKQWAYKGSISGRTTRSPATGQAMASVRGLGMWCGLSRCHERNWEHPNGNFAAILSAWLPRCLS